MTTNHIVTVPKRSSVLVVVLLTLVSGGFYRGIWYLRRRKELNALDSVDKIGVLGPAILLMLLVFHRVVPEGSAAKIIAVLAINLANMIMSFRVRSMIADHARSLITALARNTGSQERYEPSFLLTLLLDVFYLQYKINELNKMSDTWATESLPEYEKAA